MSMGKGRRAMSAINEYQRKVIRTLKGLETKDDQLDFDTEIPVVNDQNVKIGLLRPIDCRLANDTEIINSLTAWRRRFERFFFTQFEVSDERTKSWLNNVVIKDDTRILFLVLDATGKGTGNLGACSITSDSAELDNFIRGERGGDPKLMLLSGLSLIGWIYRVLNIRKISARVLANNLRTLSVYEAADCFEWSRRPGLVKESNSDESVEESGFISMTLDVQKFLSGYPWMVRPDERASGGVG
ncbi:MAG: hypothetical protein QOE33_655 [Acidobacteriota bacterium]|nr:hypothetical protein [Acidobacteriota bacterium]